MIVPEFWSEAKERFRVDGRPRTIRRFGWSDISPEDAHQNALERVKEAVSRARAGEKVRGADRKIPYNGADGLPIREEIIERHGSAVITRNSYGALCLNTPDVLFTDIDIPEKSHSRAIGILSVLFLVAGISGKFMMDSWWPLICAFIAAVFLSGPLANAIMKLMSRFKEDPFEEALARIEKFSADNLSWLLRVYRTPLGYRVLVMHSTFDPTRDEPFKFMEALKSDPLYVRMCRNQKCFRARISPKPWRIGIEHIKPRPGVWPVKPEHFEKRRRWVSEYDKKSAGFAACEYVTTLGDGRVSADCEHVRSLHDRFCRAESGLPIA